MRQWLGVAVAGLAVSPVWAGDYFLSGEQKRELIVRGQMHDEQQRLYDVWIVPGYVVPGKNVREGWHNAGEEIQAYGKPELYHDIRRFSHATWDAGRLHILRDFAFKGTREAWRQDMDVAERRTRQRVFGWWLAYPWGVLEAATESLVRIVGGVPVGVAVSASAYTVVPVVYGAVPLVTSTGYALGQGTVWPASAAAWNTVISPPLAVFGQKPAPERADGFWMKQVDDPRLANIADVLADWRMRFEQSGATKERDEALMLISQANTEQVKALEGQIHAADAEAEQKRKVVKQRWLEVFLADIAANRPSLDAALQAKGVPLTLLVSQRPAVEETLVRKAWPREDARRLLDAVIGDRFKDVPQEPVRPTNEKTDPVKRVIQVLEKP